MGAKCDGYPPLFSSNSEIENQPPNIADSRSSSPGLPESVSIAKMQMDRKVESPGLKGRGHEYEWTGVSQFRHRVSAVVFTLSSLAVACTASHWSDLLGAELHMLRGSFLVVLLVYLFLLNVRGWRAGNIAYVKMFELDSDWMVWNSISGISMHTGLMWSAGSLTTLLLFSLNWVSAVSYVPILLWAVLVVYFLWPAKSYFYEARMWMLNVLYRILVSPMNEVSFADFWVADQLNSLAVVFLDFEFSACFLVGLGTYSISDMKDLSVCTMTNWPPRLVLASLPAWWRFAQCLRCYYDTREIPHLLNAGKYFSTFPMIVTAGMLVTAQTKYPQSWRSRPELTIWFTCTFLRAIYVYIWDIRMDWGFFKCTTCPWNPLPSKHPFLRTHLLFSPHWIYYGMIILDLVLRFTFLVKLLPTLFGFVPGNVFFTAMATLEVVRRFLWNFFRLEYEQTKSMPEEPLVKPKPLSAGVPQSFLHEM